MKTYYLIIILLLAANSFGQTETNQPVTTTETTPSKIVCDNFDEVGRFFNNHKEIILKNESETEKEYKERLLNVLNETKYQEKSLKDVCFIINPDISYKAETQQFSAAAFINSVESGPQKELHIKVRADSNYFMTRKVLSFTIPPEKVKEIKNNLRMAVFGYPVNYEESINSLDVVPIKIILFDQITGEIYKEQVINKSNASFLKRIEKRIGLPPSDEWED